MWYLNLRWDIVNCKVWGSVKLPILGWIAICGKTGAVQASAVPAETAPRHTELKAKKYIYHKIWIELQLKSYQLMLQHIAFS